VTPTLAFDPYAEFRVIVCCVFTVWCITLHDALGMIHEAARPSRDGPMIVISALQAARQGVIQHLGLLPSGALSATTMRLLPAAAAASPLPVVGTAATAVLITDNTALPSATGSFTLCPFAAACAQRPPTFPSMRALAAQPACAHYMSWVILVEV